MGFTVKKGSEKGSQKGFREGVSRRRLERPLVEYAPLGVRPNQDQALQETGAHLNGNTHVLGNDS